MAITERPAELLELKRRARGQASKARTEAHAIAGETAGLVLAKNGLPMARSGASVISGFYPHKSEISVLPLLAKLASEGWRTALPIVVSEGQPLVFRSWAPGEATRPGIWDIPMPLETAAEVDPDVLLVPMLAFDRKGYRLGYGGGFYDRTLAKLRRQKQVTAIGIAYAGQEVDAVPHGPWDEPLDWIMTEEGAFRPVKD